MKPISDDGAELNATFSVEKPPLTHGFDLIIESRSGARHRNSDYQKAFVLLLARMSARNMLVKNLEIDTSKVQGISPSERSLRLSDFPYPISLNSISHFVGLQQAIGRELKRFGNFSGKGGNPTKRVRLIIAWDEARNLTASEIESVLAEPQLSSPLKDLWIESSTSDPDLLERRVENAQRRASVVAKQTQMLAPPIGSVYVTRSTAQLERFIRDPNVIAWILFLANGRCEICEEPAPFTRQSGDSYLEVHHVRPLSQGGPDTPDNAVACCANCHRRFHYSSDRVTFRTSSIERIGRLKDYPEISEVAEDR